MPIHPFGRGKPPEIPSGSASIRLVTRLVTGVDPATAEGKSLALAHGATECLVAAEQLDNGMPDFTGEYILTFHALELGLKAFLVKCGVTDKDLRSYRHDLVRLYEVAKQRGMSLSVPDVEAMLGWANEWHCDGVKIRYEFTRSRTLPVCNTLFPLAGAIINASHPRSQIPLGCQPKRDAS